MNTIAPHDTVWLAVADLHGHRAHFNALLGWDEAEFGPQLHVFTLGDNVDNGREIPALLDDLIALRERLGERFVPIAGQPRSRPGLRVTWLSDGAMVGHAVSLGERLAHVALLA